MLDFTLILCAAVAGYLKAPASAIAVVAAGLIAISYARNHAVYARGLELGLVSLMRRTAIMTSWQALAAAGMAFGGGTIIRVFAGG